MNPQTNTLRPRILVAPLDWGLGHATRCVPLIKELLTTNCEVLLAGEGAVAHLLSTEFPELTLLSLKGYNVSYGKNGWELFGKLLLQVPKLIEAIDEEHNWLQNAIIVHRIDAVISDNRFGFFNETIPSVFITHQLLIKTGLGATADELLQKLAYEYVNAFTECWVPDVATVPNLAADLAHPQKVPAVPVHYIGALSRLKKASATKQHLLIILSGPEPQRTLLETTIVQQLERYTAPVLFVRGLPGTAELLQPFNQVKFINHLPALQLEDAINAASIIISRCGYSTVMDVMALQKKSILIPTPGQTEQEYLATHLMKNNLAFCIPQSKFKLINALELAETFNYKWSNFEDKEALQNTVHQFVQKIKTAKNNVTDVPADSL